MKIVTADLEDEKEDLSCNFARKKKKVILTSKVKKVILTSKVKKVILTSKVTRILTVIRSIQTLIIKLIIQSNSKVNKRPVKQLLTKWLRNKAKSL